VLVPSSYLKVKGRLESFILLWDAAAAAALVSGILLGILDTLVSLFFPSGELSFCLTLRQRVCLWTATFPDGPNLSLEASSMVMSVTAFPRRSTTPTEVMDFFFLVFSLLSFSFPLVFVATRHNGEAGNI
jgi:hypothetical protein